MGTLRYDGVVHDIPDEDLATLQLALSAAIDARSTFLLEILTDEDSTVIQLGAGIAVSLQVGPGTVDHRGGDVVAKWQNLARGGGLIELYVGDSD